MVLISNIIYKELYFHIQVFIQISIVIVFKPITCIDNHLVISLIYVFFVCAKIQIKIKINGDDARVGTRENIIERVGTST
jgi:hypothetical protein